MKLSDFTEQKAQEAADKGLLEALKFSYEKWDFLINTNDERKYHYTVSSTCPLCILFRDKCNGKLMCEKCPIGIAGHACNQLGRGMNLWADAADYVRSNYALWRNTAQKFVVLLKELYEAERDKET